MTHTPGPWSIVPIFGLCNVTGADDRSICSTGGYSNNVLDSGAVRAENEANARLVAAAPELLAACQAFVDRFDGGSRADTDYVADMMRTAIIKAIGETK